MAFNAVSKARKDRQAWSGESTETELPPENPFLIVGIGASAGGLSAFEEFFSGMPTDADPGMAFVLVQHLAPDHKSMLADLVARQTRMQVFEVEDGMVVQSNCAYIIPPNHDMTLLDGALHLLTPTESPGLRLPIDFFFRALAQDQGERAVGIVLSGTGSDGTAGIRAIKAEGGMVMAQTPDSAEFDGMPRNALATGVVDFQLEAAEMPAQLITYAAHAVSKLAKTATVAAPASEHTLKKILILLRNQTGHDFSQYKPNTIVRRIERRMAVHQLASLDDYFKYLQKTATEAGALFSDLLIGVTNFFRDPQAYQALAEHVIPRLFEGKSAGAQIRVWSIGCSTGEEAYSLAILLQEHQEVLKQPCTVQVFATDLAPRAIAIARAGIYPAGIAADLSQERLNRFFTPEPDGSSYRIHKSIRDMLVFSEHDLIRDPPFSKIDLISCRNLLIYLNAPLQKRLIPLFHYALNPGQFLFLGASETVGDSSDLFASIDNKYKVYRRKNDMLNLHRQALSRYHPPATVPRAPPMTEQLMGGSSKRSLRELAERTLLQHLTLAGVLVNMHGDILYLHGRSGMYLELPAGEAGINNILNMAREGLRHELAPALQKAVGSNKIVHAHGLRVRTNGHFARVDLTIRPVPVNRGAASTTSLYLIILEETAAADGGQRAPTEKPAAPLGTNTIEPAGAMETSAEKDARIAALTEELHALEEYLKASNYEMESTNSDLRSSNEELQSMNEELQSTNEELETSKEEMQSLAEELSTVNTELQTKMADLSRASNDLNNLLAGTGIGTVFVDHNLCILRFTAAATRIINLIPSDVGRPVAHTVTKLVDYDSLVVDAQSVLDTLVPREVNVQTQDGAWYMMRILPYRTDDNVIEGAVISFVDITELVKTRQALKEAEAQRRLAVVVSDAYDAITVQNLSGRILAWNPGATRMYGWTEAEALAMNVSDRIPPELREKESNRVYQLCQSETLEPYRTQRLTRHGASVDVSLTSTALVNESGKIYAIATTERLTEAIRIA